MNWKSAAGSMYTASQEAQVFGRKSRGGISPTADAKGISHC